MCFCELGDNRWTKAVGSPSAVQDVVYYQEKFYAIDQIGTTVSYSGKDPNAESQVVAVGPQLPFPPPRRYLVASAGNLLQVFRYKKHTIMSMVLLLLMM